MSITRPANTAFIQKESRVNWWDSSIITQTDCTFNKSVYGDQLFAYLGIAFPETLKNAVIKRKAEFLAGRHCAQQALSLLGVQHSTIGIGKLKNPLWPKGIKGSISHCSDVAVAVVSHAPHVLGIGIDIEEQIEEDMIEQVGTYVLLNDEKQLLQQKTMTTVQVFTLIFSMKESFFKAAFPLVKSYFDFDAVTVLDIDHNKVRFKLNYSLHEHLQKEMLFTGQFRLLNTPSSERKNVASFITILRD